MSASRSGPRDVVAGLLRPATGFALSCSRGRGDVVVFFEYEHPGAPGVVTPVAQVAVPVELLRRLHAAFGQALEHLEMAAEPDAALSLADLPPNVRLFPQRPPEGP